MGTRLFVGTSGWAYPHWAGSFYPPRWPPAQRLTFYASQFPAVEVNVTCYRLATAAMVTAWQRATARDFLFCFKGSRFITHMKRLLEPDLAVKRFFAPLRALRARAGPVLWQLPPTLRCEPPLVARLERFLARLPRGWRHAVEFRHPSWHESPEVQALLTRRRVARVWVSSQAMPADTRCTADFVYLRFHGLSRGAHHHYTRRQLEPWARALAAADRPAFAFFNNDLNPHVARNARLLQALLPPADLAQPSRSAPAHDGRGGWAPADVWRPWG